MPYSTKSKFENEIWCEEDIQYWRLNSYSCLSFPGLFSEQVNKLWNAAVNKIKNMKNIL